MTSDMTLLIVQKECSLWNQGLWCILRWAD